MCLNTEYSEVIPAPPRIDRALLAISSAALTL